MKLVPFNLTSSVCCDKTQNDNLILSYQLVKKLKSIVVVFY